METILDNATAAFITGVMGPVVLYLVTNYIKKQNSNKKDTVVESIDTTIIINQELEGILKEFNADRIWISQFHNGGNFYPTGKSIQKFSIFYEVTKPGISTIANIFTNIPCSLYPKAFQHMIENKSIFIPDWNDTDVDTYGLRGAGEAGGNKSSYNLAMFTFDGKYMGVLGLDYVSKKHKLSKDEWEHFQIRASKISGYLSLYLNKTQK